MVEIKEQSVSQLVVFELDKGIDELEHHKMALVTGNRHVGDNKGTRSCSFNCAALEIKLIKRKRKEILNNLKITVKTLRNHQL